MALTQISTQGIKDGTITGTDLATNVDLVDNQKLRLGSSNDLEIYHSGSASIINNSTGVLIQRSDTGINLRSDALNLKKGDDSEFYLKCAANGGVELYHNNTKTFETTGEGVTFDTGSSSCVVRLTSNTDAITVLQGFNSDFLIKAPSGGGVSILTNANESSINCISNGSVELYHDNSKKFETTSSGVDITHIAQIGTSTDQGELRIGHDGSSYRARLVSNSSVSLEIDADGPEQIEMNGGVIYMRPINSEKSAAFVANAGVELYHNNSKKFDTTTYGVKVTGRLAATTSITGADNVQIKLGDGDDLQIEHDGSASYITNSTGVLGIQSDELHLSSKTGGEPYLKGFVNGAVELYYDNSKKFETTNDGVKVGSVTIDSAFNNIGLPDGGQVRFGAGEDLRIYHDGSNSVLLDNGTGNLKIYSNGAGVDIQKSNGENIARFITDGAVELYHDNSKKFETTSTGVTVSGKTTFNDDLFGGDNVVLRLGDASGGDFKFFHNGSTNVISGEFHPIEIRHQSEVHIKCVDDGAVELYHDNVKQMETTSLGASIRNHHKFMTGTVAQRVFQANNFAICTRLNVASAGSNNGQGSFIRASANCSNIDDDQTVKFVVFGTGDTQNANNSYAGFSDVNLKQDIADASSQWDDIKNLRVRKYRFKNNPTGPLQIGCIAQEAETVSPGLIETDPEEGFKSLKYSVLYMKAIKCLQEAMAKIEVLETEVAALKAG